MVFEESVIEVKSLMGAKVSQARLRTVFIQSRGAKGLEIIIKIFFENLTKLFGVVSAILVSSTFKVFKINGCTNKKGFVTPFEVTKSDFTIGFSVVDVVANRSG